MTINACMEIILNTQVCIKIVHNFLLFKTFDNKSCFVLVMQEEKDKIANTVKGLVVLFEYPNKYKLFIKLSKYSSFFSFIVVTTL
jgi:hypothetical protein